MTTFNITLKAIVRNKEVIFQALAEKDKKEGQHIIWKENKYLEDAIKDLGREIREIVAKEQIKELNPSEMKG